MYRSNILIVPHDNTEKEINDALIRISWYFAFEEGVRFYIDTELPIPQTLDCSGGYNQSSNDYFSSIRDRIFNKSSISDDLSFGISISFNHKKVISRAKNNLCADRFTVSQDGQIFIRVLNILRSSEQQKNVTHSFKQLENLLHKFPGRNRNVNLFATGPNLEEVFSRLHSIKNGVNIICNSAILHKKLLEHVTPDILVFADPIFHFGPSTYAESFIKEYKAFIAKFPNCFTVIPLQYSAIFKKHYKNLDNVIFLPSYVLEVPNLNLSDFFGAKISNNILTYLMFPIATSLGSHITFYGFDGKSEKSGYFWKHNKNAQFSDELPAIQKIHPAFFNISYDNYYVGHCNLLRKYINYGLEKGFTFEAGTTTYIEPLKVFEFLGVKKFSFDKVKSVKTVLISILPNMKGSYGHHLSHEVEINKHLPANSQHILLAHKAFNLSIKNIEVESIYSQCVWEQKDPSSRYDFFLETLAALYQIEKELDRDIESVQVTFYMSADFQIEYFLKLESLFRKKKFFFHVNLFYVNTQLTDVYGNLKLQMNHFFLEKLGQYNKYSKNLFFYVDNNVLQDYFRDVFQIDLDVWPHFSSTKISDQYCYSQAPIYHTIYYPSFIQQERGVTLLVANLQKCEDFLKAQNINLKLRLCDLSNDQQNIKILKDKVGLPRFINYVEGELSNEDYARHIHESSIIIIPYSKVAFRFRTSAVLIDAVRLRKPVLVCSGTWMASIVKNHGIGEIYDEDHTQSLVAAIEKLTKDYPRYLENVINFEANNPFTSVRYLETLFTMKNEENLIIDNDLSIFAGPVIPSYFKPQAPKKPFLVRLRSLLVRIIKRVFV